MPCWLGKSKVAAKRASLPQGVWGQAPTHMPLEWRILHERLVKIYAMAICCFNFLISLFCPFRHSISIPISIFGNSVLLQCFPSLHSICSNLRRRIFLFKGFYSEITLVQRYCSSLSSPEHLISVPLRTQPRHYRFLRLRGRSEKRIYRRPWVWGRARTVQIISTHFNRIYRER